MSRYIDADVLIKEKAYASDMWDRETQSFDLPIIEVRDIDDAPTIDIVRCKECRWLDKGENESCSWSMCTRHFGQYINVNADDFCSYGEREGE